MVTVCVVGHLPARPWRAKYPTVSPFRDTNTSEALLGLLTFRSVEERFLGLVSGE